jgi:CBS domain-containing protein
MNAALFASHSEILCQAETAVPAVYRLMTETGSPLVVVVESVAHRNPIGFITEHTICEKTISGGFNPRRLSAEHVMDPNFVTAPIDARVDECLRIFEERGGDWIFLVDERGGYRGAVGRAELEKVRPGEAPHRRCAPECRPAGAVTLEWVLDV